MNEYTSLVVLGIVVLICLLLYLIKKAKLIQKLKDLLFNDLTK